MRAAIMHSVDRPISIETVEPLPPNPTDVVVRTEATGVCHSDISGIRGYLGLQPPAIIGHEAAGVVVETGSEVTGLRPGDRVVASLVPVCGNCYWCVNGQTHLCGETMSVRRPVRGRLAGGEDVTAMLGLGAFADHMTMDQRLAVKVESDLPAEQLALIGCGIATGAGAAMFTAQVRPGSSVAVIGCGGVGQSVIQGARIAGAAQIIAVDLVEMKRTVSLQNGATSAVDPAEGDVAEQVRALTRGRGADYAFEVVGTPATMALAYDCARRGGMVTTVGIPSPTAKLELSASDFFRAEKRMVGSYYGSTQVRADFQRFADLIAAGKFDAASLITHRYELDGLQQAFADLESGQSIRGIVTFA
jgi:S-(hydroxymethyl)glutathione dehydrogenase / alcohol dehydrogenase